MREVQGDYVDVVEGPGFDIIDGVSAKVGMIYAGKVLEGPGLERLEAVVREVKAVEVEASGGEVRVRDVLDPVGAEVQVAQGLADVDEGHEGDGAHQIAREIDMREQRNLQG